jgi:acetolactate synthase small subunit
MKDFEQKKLAEVYQGVYDKKILKESIDISFGSDFLTQVIPAWTAVGASVMALVLGNKYSEKIKNFLNKFVTKYAIKELENNSEFKRLIELRTKSQDNQERSQLTIRIYEMMLDTFANSTMLSKLKISAQQKQEIVNSFRERIVK